MTFTTLLFLMAQHIMQDINLKECPTITENNSLFNIPNKGSNNVLILNPNIKKITNNEIIEIKSKISQLLKENFLFFGYLESASNYKSYLSIDNYFPDRTVSLNMSNFYELNYNLIKKFQTILLNEFPDWRILINTDPITQSIIIYKTAIRIGESKKQKPSEDEFNAHIIEVQKTRLKMDIHWQIQKEYIDLNIHKYTRLIMTKNDVLFIGFDNFNGDFSKVSILALYKTEDNYYSLSSNNKNISRSDGLPILNNKINYLIFNEKRREKSDFFLSRFIINKDQNEPIEFLIIYDGINKPIKTNLELNKIKIIKHDDLIKNTKVPLHKVYIW